MAVTKVVFVGCYTIRSAGDDAPLAFLTTALRERLGPCDFVVLARHPSPEFDRFHGVRTIAGFEHESREAAQGRWMRGLNVADERSHLRGIADEIASADLVVLGAGNFFTEVSFDLFRGNFAMILIAAAIAEMAGTPYFLFAMSANALRLPWAVKAAAWVLRRASAVIFRDRSAVTNLVGSGVALPTHRVLPDPALGAPPCDPRRSAEILQQEGIDLVGREVLAVALRNLSYMNAQEPYEAMLAEVVDRWNQRGPQRAVLFIPQCSYHVGDPGTDDRHMARCLARRVATKSQCFFIEGEHQSSEIECLYAEARVTLATRLHGCVFSVKMGTATLGLAYEDKVSGFFDQLGMPEACLPLDATAEEVFRQIEQLAQKADTLRPLLLEKVEGLRQELCGYVNTAVDLIAERQRQLSAAKENQP